MKMTTAKHTAAVRFFKAHAGFSWDPRTETEAQGRYKTARWLAAAERAGRDAGLSFHWERDEHTDSRDFSDARPAWGLWVCVCRDAAGGVVASLGGIDFGRDGEPWGDDYRRVVEAELAAEARRA